MTSRDFIVNRFGKPAKRTTTCSSVMADDNGNIFSYGWHYPLLFKVGNLVFRNVAGFSVTTSKHIGYCYGFGAHDIVLPRYYVIPQSMLLEPRGQTVTLSRIEDFVVDEMAQLTWTILGKKRKDTQLVRDLKEKLHSRQQTLDAIKTELNRLNTALETEVRQPA